MISYDGITKLVADIPHNAREWRNDHNIWRWCRQNTLIDNNHHKDWLAKISTDESIRMFGICNIEDTPIGVVGLTSISMVNRTAEWSLYINDKFQGKGLSKSALRNIILYGFKCLNLNIIWGECFSNNIRAIKLATNMGFKKDGVLRERYYKDGDYLDSIILSIKRDELHE